MIAKRPRYALWLCEICISISRHCETAGTYMPYLGMLRTAAVEL